MLKKTQLSIAVGAALGISSLTFMPANAQELSANQLEEVIVTGSRITRANLVSASPVTQVSAEELKFAGTVRVEDMMRTLPQVYSQQNTTNSNGATGTATLNLRNLGDERTLVLINGRRMPAGSPLQGGVGADINQIPGALIKTVEVLTGGASATYGSDAVAGVVNFIMMDDFEGVKLDYQYSAYNHDNRSNKWQGIVEDAGYPAPSGDTTDGDMNDLSFILGGNFDGGRGNAVAYATYRKIDPILQKDRDYSACALSDDATGCFGSSTIPQGRFTDFDTFDYIVQGNNFVDRQGETYNYGALNYYQRPDKRYTLGSFAHYDVNEHVEAYTELMYMNDSTVSQIAPSGAFFVTDTIPCNNAFMSDQQFDALCGQFGLTKDDVQTAYLGRRNVEGGNRQQDLEYNSFRGVFGLRGEINDTWRYDTYFLRSQVDMSNTYQNDLASPNIAKSLQAVVDPNTGNIVCQGVIDGSDPNCVPWNVFETGGVTDEALNYLVLPLFARGSTEQTIASGYVEGNLGDYGIKSPFANDGIDVVLGAEYRKENLDFNPDKGFQDGLGAGQGGATQAVSGSYEVKEGFMEASIPVVEGKTLMDQVVLDGGYRYSDYDYGETTNTYGVRLGWAFNSQVKARASYQRAVRAPNIQELFLPQGFNLFDMTGDPCSDGVAGGKSAGGYTQAECARSGLQAGNWGKNFDSPAGQYNYLQGGNTNLSPEKSDTYTVGIVLTPDMVEGLSLTIDYYDIKIEDGISNLTPEFILTECLDGDDSQCAKVRRGNGGDLWVGSDVNKSGRIEALQDNLANEQVKGVDFVAVYQFDVGSWGSVELNNVLSYVDSWDTQELSGAPTTDCAGNWGSVCGQPTPDTRNNFRATWTTPWSVTASAQWRYISDVKDLNEFRDLDEVNYLDIAGIWDINEWASVRAGVNNATDKAPPIAGNGAGPSIYGNGNTFPGMYDAMGRYFYVGATIGF
ncbi:MAG: TonB-dependent receptor [Pseudomonadales bacterium]|nr:TonB-dependent receptor [Pseudomonadales bacterium]